MRRAPVHGHDDEGGSTTATVLAVRAPDEYDAALAILLAEAGRRPGLFVRVGRMLLAVLAARYAQTCAEADHLEPWHWFVDC
jgi:hypothetical protein